MKVEKFINPIAEENMYVISKNSDCYIVDPGDIYMSRVIEYIKENNLDLKGVLLTHGHFDHIMGLEKVMEYKEVPIYIPEKEIEYLYNPNLSLATMINSDFKLNKNHKVIGVNEGDKIFDFDIINTPGHTSGSICYYSPENKVLISGDTILKSSYGRVDLPTGSMEDMTNSLRKLIKLPDDVIIYSGHGGITSIGKEKRYYFYL